MAEYITKERALEAVTRNLPLYGDEWVAAYNIVGAIPAADVAPVVHAKWKFVAGPDEDNNVQVMCDNCGAGDVHAADVTVPYCWRCSAQKDGGERDD